MTLGLHFPERMTGWIRFDTASPPLERRVCYPIDLRLQVFSDAPTSLQHPRQVTGLALFPGFPGTLSQADLVDAASVRGTMENRLSGVRYDLLIEARRGGPLRLVGEKRYRLSLLDMAATQRTLTTLDLDLFDGERRTGDGQIAYRGSIRAFLAGIRAVHPDANGAYDPHRAIARDLASLVPALLPEHKRFTTDEGVIERLRLQLIGLPRSTLLLMRLDAAALRVAIRLRFGDTAGADIAQWRKISSWLGGRRRLRSLVLPLSTVLLAAVFGDQRFRDSSGQHRVIPPKDREVEPWMVCHSSPTSSDPERVDEIEADVVIIGSGAGGAAAAYTLASSGLAVAVVEEGPYYKRPQLTGDRLDMVRRLYHRQGLQFAFGNSPLWVPTGRCVGGTTVINCGTSMRTPQAVLARWASELGLRDLGLERHFDEVEQMLDVKPVATDLQGGIRDVLERGLEGTGYKLEALPRGETDCDGQTVCIYGCPTGAKRSTDVSFLPAAMRRGAQVFSGLAVDRLIFEGGRAVGVEAGPRGLGDLFRLRIRARAVLLGAGALATPALLAEHGLRHELPQIGRNLTLHPALNVSARFPRRVREARFVPQSLGVFGIEEQGFALEGHTLRVDDVPLTLLLAGPELAEILDNIDRVTNFAAMTTDQTFGRLLFPPRGAPVPWYWLTPSTTRTLRGAAALLAEIFLRAGAHEVYLPVDEYEKVKGPRDVARLRATNIPASHFRFLSAHHPLGTCRMGSSPHNSVLSPAGKVWGREGLYAVDGSAIPGPLGANPQVTIMANAMRIASALADDLA